MTVTTVASGNRVQQWSDTFYNEFIRENRFATYMGDSENSLIHVKEDLAKAAGDSLTWSTVRKLSQSATRGAVTLSGNEEQLNNRSLRVYVELVRHGVRIDTKTEQIKTELDLFETARYALKEWHMETLKMDIINYGLMSIDGTKFSDATTSQKNTWVTNNSDRVLFGKLNSNYSTTFATALGNIDSTNDTLTPAAVSLMKRIARTASPAIRPLRIRNDEEWFVLFVPTYSFRDLATHSDMLSANRDAWDRGKDNPIFTGGDLIWDGVIIKEIPEIPVQVDLGTSLCDVAPSFLCGQQAVAMAQVQRAKAIEDTPQDYGRFRMPGVEMIRGITKMRFGTSATADTTTPKDHGIVTGWFAAQPDS